MKRKIKFLTSCTAGHMPIHSTRSLPTVSASRALSPADVPFLAAISSSVASLWPTAAVVWLLRTAPPHLRLVVDVVSVSLPTRDVFLSPSRRFKICSCSRPLMEVEDVRFFLEELSDFNGFNHVEYG
jgi:hypothetical protein